MNKVTINNKEVKLPSTVVMPVAYAGVMAMMGVVAGTAIGLLTDGACIVKKLIDKVKK